MTEDTGAVVALDKNTGASVWKQDKLSYRDLSAPLAVRIYVVVGDFEGHVHFLKFEDGSFAARIATDGSGIAAAPRLIGRQGAGADAQGRRLRDCGQDKK